MRRMLVGKVKFLRVFFIQWSGILCRRIAYSLLTFAFRVAVYVCGRSKRSVVNWEVGLRRKRGKKQTREEEEKRKKEQVFTIFPGDEREVKSGQAEAFDSPTESSALRTVPADKPPPPCDRCARTRRGYTSRRLRRVNRNAGHESTDARENHHCSFVPLTLPLCLPNFSSFTS